VCALDPPPLPQGEQRWLSTERKEGTRHSAEEPPQRLCSSFWSQKKNGHQEGGFGLPFEKPVGSAGRFVGAAWLTLGTKYGGASNSAVTR
jgi:hypothetical protein